MSLARRSLLLLAVLSTLAPAALASAADEASRPPAAPTAAAAPFDPVAATNAYLATIPAADRARTNAYFEGGYWLLLWDFLLGAAVNYGLLASGVSRRMRDLAERLSRVPP